MPLSLGLVCCVSVMDIICIPSLVMYGVADAKAQCQGYNVLQYSPTGALRHCIVTDTVSLQLEPP